MSRMTLMPGKAEPPVSAPVMRAGYFPAELGTRDYIRNCTSRFEIHYTSKEQPYVVSLPDGSRPSTPTTYLGSASATLLDYPLSAIPLVHAAMTRKAPTSLGRYLRQIGARQKLTVGLFNTPLSNVHLPDNYLSIVTEILPHYLKQYPHNTIMIRGLQQKRHGDSFGALRKLGFGLVPYRRLYHIENLDPKKARGQLKNDLGILRKNRELISEPAEPLQPHEYEKLARLYSEIYIQKYSCLNPDYTPAFLAYMHRSGLLHLILCRDGTGTIVGFVGYTIDEKSLACSIVGYDRSKPYRPSLYILLMAALADAAIRRKLTLNFGAGNAKFKIARGGVVDYEFLAMHASTCVLLQATTRICIALLRGSNA